MPPEPPALVMEGVGLTRDGRDLLDGVDWEVRAGQQLGGARRQRQRQDHRWCASPRSTSTRAGHGRGPGRDARAHRRARRCGGGSPWSARRWSTWSARSSRAAEVVVCAKYAALEPWWHRYDDGRPRPGPALLADQGVGVAWPTDRSGSLSSGERQRVLLARAPHVGPGPRAARRAHRRARPRRPRGAGRPPRRAGPRPRPPRRWCWSPTTSRRSRRPSPTCSRCGTVGCSARADRRRPSTPTCSADVLRAGARGCDRHDDGRWTARRPQRP